MAETHSPDAPPHSGGVARELQPVAEEPAAGGVELLCASLELREEGVGALRVERLGEIGAVLGDVGPLTRHLGCDLEVELDPEAALARLEGRRGDGGARQGDGAIGEIEGVTVPLQRREGVLDALEQGMLTSL